MTAIQRAYTAHCDRAELVRSIAAIHAAAYEAIKRAAQEMREQGEPTAARWLDLCAAAVDAVGAKHLRRLKDSTVPAVPSAADCMDASSNESASQTRPVVVQSVAPRDDDRAEFVCEYVTDDGQVFTSQSVMSAIYDALDMVSARTAINTQEREQSTKFLAVAHSHVERAIRSKAECIYLKHAAQKVAAALRVMGAVR